MILGLGQGASFALALTLIVLRSADARTAGQLSSMAQGVDYCLAAAGPLLVGVLHSWTGSWSALAGLFLVIGMGALVAGLGAGANAHMSRVAMRDSPTSRAPPAVGSCARD